jgi:hypothetical protein
MPTDPAEKLRELALSVTRGDLRRPWSVQTSNSFRRIGTNYGDGDVLCAVKQRYDGQPDLHASPDVLDYIVAAHPLVILQLIRERDSARHALHFLRHKIAWRDRIFREAGGMAGIHLAATGEDQSLSERASAVVRGVIEDLTDRAVLPQTWEEIDAGIRQIVGRWEKIAREQISESRDDVQDPQELVTSSAGGIQNLGTTSSLPGDNLEAIWKLEDLVGDLRASELGWSGLERERLLVAVEGALTAYRAGTASDVALDARALLAVLRGSTAKAVEVGIADAARAHTRSAMADPAGAGRAGAFLFGVCGMDDKVTAEVEEILMVEIERAYVAGASLMRGIDAQGINEQQATMGSAVLRGLRAMTSALTAPQAEHPDVRAACEGLAADLPRGTES